MPRPCVETPCPPPPGMDSRSSPRQDPGIGLVSGGRARDQTCPPHPAPHPAVFRATAHISPTAADHGCMRLRAIHLFECNKTGWLADQTDFGTVHGCSFQTTYCGRRCTARCAARREPPESVGWGLALVGFILTQPRAASCPSDSRTRTESDQRCPTQTLSAR